MADIRGRDDNDTLRGGTRTVGGTAKARGLGGVDPRLVRIIDAAAARSPYDVQIFSGTRPGRASGSRHNTGNAVDIALVDPTSGQVIPNYKSSTGFPIYAEFAKVAREEQMRLAPDMAGAFRWGGGFSDKDFDLMHFDFKPGGAMAYWTWEDGGKLTAAGAEAVPKFGPGYIYYDGKRYAAPEGQYASLWGREPLTMAEQAAQAEQGIVGGVNANTVGPETAKLAGVMLAEARGEGRDGMVGVGNVVLNRAESGSRRFPTEISSVINNEFAAPLGPNDVSPEEWTEAVNIAMGLRGGQIPDNTGGAVYFANVDTASPTGYGAIKASGPASVTIGNHTYHIDSDIGPVARASPLNVSNIVEARAITEPNIAVAPPPGTESYTPFTPNIPPPPTARPQFVSGGKGVDTLTAGNAGAIPPAPTQRPSLATDGPPMAGGGGGGLIAGNASRLEPMRLSGGSGGGLIASSASKLPPRTMASGFRPLVVGRPETPAPTGSPASRGNPISGASGGPLIAGNATALPPTPKQRPTIASAAPVMDMGPEWGGPAEAGIMTVGAGPIAASGLGKWVAPPDPIQGSPSAAYEPKPPEPDPTVPGTLFAAPGDTIAEYMMSDRAPGGTIPEMVAASDALPTGMGGTMASAPPMVAEPAEPIMASVQAPIAPQSTHRPPTGTQPTQQAQTRTMATAGPPQAQGGGWFSGLMRALTPNTGGSRGFVASGPGGVAPGGYVYQTGGNVIGTGGQYTTPGGRTITYVQDDHFGQPGYLTGYG